MTRLDDGQWRCCLGKTCVDTVLCFGTVRVQSVVENRLKDFRRATGIEKPAPQLYLWMRAFFMEFWKW